MEKKALLAFVLSFMVLFLWEMYFGSGRHQQTTAPQQSQAPAPPSTSSPQTGAELPQGAGPVAEGTLPQDRPLDLGRISASWTVDSPLYALQIHDSGGRILGFELKNFKESAGPDAPPMELIPSRSLGYLPLAVDSLRHPEWQLSTRKFTSEAPQKLTLSPSDSSKSFTISTEVPGQVRLSKTFTFLPDSYAIDLTLKLENLTSEPMADQLGVSFYYMPYSTNEGSYNLSNLAVYRQGSLEHHPVKDLVKTDPTFTSPYGWVGYQNNYFLDAFVPLDESPSQVKPRTLDAGKGLIQTVYLTEPFEVPGNQERALQMRLYLGPKELNRLREAGHDLVKSVDYGWFGFLARPLVDVLKWLNGYFHNYGVAIIILTIIIKIIFWPLTHKSYKSMQMMKKLQPKINQVREKYKDDREKLNQELMMLYRTYKVNPLGGCLPMVLQIPVFFALYRMLSNSVELLHEPFALWIHDLTAPDRLYVGFNIPYLGGLPVLTILMGLTMFIQQKMTPSTGDPRQEKIMLLMPIMFTFFFFNFPAGLVLYWLVNNVLSIAQQYWINRSV
jgi:YidC/Oxa1 family membrane protein insertase